MKFTSIAEFFSNLFLNVSKHNIQTPKRNFVVNGTGLVITRNSSLTAAAGSTVDPGVMASTSVPIAEVVSATMTPVMCADNHWFTLRKKPADFTSIQLARVAAHSNLAMNSPIFDLWSFFPFFIANIKNAAETAVNYLAGLEYSHTFIAANAIQHRDDSRKSIPFCLSFGICSLSGDWTNTFLKANIFVKKINEAGGIELTKVTEIPGSSFKTFGDSLLPTKFHLYTTIDKTTLANGMPTDKAALYHPHLYVELVFQNYRVWTANIRLEESHYPSITTPISLPEALRESGALFCQKRIQTMPIVTGTSLTATTYTTTDTGVTMESLPTFTSIAAAWPTGGTAPTFASGSNPTATGTYCLNFLPGDGSSIRIACRDDTNGRSISQIEFRLTSNAVRFSIPLS